MHFLFNNWRINSAAAFIFFYTIFCISIFAQSNQLHSCTNHSAITISEANMQTYVYGYFAVEKTPCIPLKEYLFIYGKPIQQTQIDEKENATASRTNSNRSSRTVRKKFSPPANMDELLEQVRQGRRDLKNIRFNGIDLAGVNFSYTDLTNASFVGCDLRGANFFGATLDSTNFTDSFLRGANFSGASINRTNFSRAYLHYCKFTNIKNVDLSVFNPAYTLYKSEFSADLRLHIKQYLSEKMTKPTWNWRPGDLSSSSEY